MTKFLITKTSILISGALLTLAFAPFNIWIFSILSPALLLFCCESVSPRRAFARALLFGAGFFGTSVSWVYVSLHDYGQADVWLACLMTFLMVLILASYNAIACYILNRFFPALQKKGELTTRNIQSLVRYLIAFPSLWVLAEWARGWVFTGFPWVLLGYSQLKTPLIGWAPVISVYGISWIVIATAGVIVLFLKLPKKKKNFKPLYLPTLFVAALWLIGFGLSYIHWVAPNGRPIQVSLVQGNIPQTLKWAPDQASESFEIYKQLTLENIKSDVIVWPESALTLTQNQAGNALEQLDELAKTYHAALITGLPIVKNRLFYNGMMALGEGEGTYYKRHLVPFGEFIPLRSWLMGFDKYIQIPMSDFRAGERYQPLMQIKGMPVAPFICYEIAYPLEVLDMLPQGQFIVVLSDDSWFGESIAAAQHLQIAQMRAVETGRYVLMSTNDGITAMINAQGEIQAIAPPFKRTVLTGNIQPMEGSTPWVYIGKYFLWIMLVLVLLPFGSSIQKFWRKL